MTETLRICEGLPQTFRIWVGPTLVLFLIKPEDMQIVLNADSCLRKSFVYSFLHKDVALFTAPRKNIFIFFSVFVELNKIHKRRICIHT